MTLDTRPSHQAMQAIEGERLAADFLEQLRAQQADADELAPIAVAAKPCAFELKP